MKNKSIIYKYKIIFKNFEKNIKKQSALNN